ncbi:MAG TPA: YaaC family protein [Terriglobales bacterium]|jgi:hypothetical protein
MQRVFLQMTNNEVWQQLLSLESRDATSQWFARIHSRELNARRAKEINAAAKQAREYFRNAGEAAHSVRPLLTFYGVACLSRSLLLLLKANGGEEGLTPSHGLETVDWGSVMKGDLAQALRSLSNLRVRISTGLFSDFISNTKNRMSIHVNSSAVDWHLCYDVPQVGGEVTFDELCARIPDLQKDYMTTAGSTVYSPISEMTFSDKDGFRAEIKETSFTNMRTFYEACGYTVTSHSIAADTKTFEQHVPLFVHSYIHKSFGSIPQLYLTIPFSSGARYSQLGITYMVAYILGMLVRYYPTHWMALIQSEKGDTWWPTINRAQHLVEVSFPELVIELLQDILKESEAKAPASVK